MSQIPAASRPALQLASRDSAGLARSTARRTARRLRKIIVRSFILALRQHRWLRTPCANQRRRKAGNPPGAAGSAPVIRAGPPWSRHDALDPQRPIQPFERFPPQPEVATFGRRKLGSAASAARPRPAKHAHEPVRSVAAIQCIQTANHVIGFARPAHQTAICRVSGAVPPCLQRRHGPQPGFLGRAERHAFRTCRPAASRHWTDDADLTCGYPELAMATSQQKVDYVARKLNHRLHTRASKKS